MEQIMNAIAADPLSFVVQHRDASTLTMVRQALKTGNVTLAFQPVVSPGRGNRPAFYEALLRVRDAQGRIIPAKDFIFEIEDREEGRIMDCLALTQGLAVLRQFPNIRLSVNMSARSINYMPWENAFKEGLAQDPTIADRLILEITESSAMDCPDLVVDFMDRMHAHGVSFALDDFGAGFTAFRYFKDFLFDIVKIDKSFIRNIDKDADNQVLAAALVSIARQFEMIVVAEGVETEQEAAYLAAMGVDCLQGYHFAAPSLRHPWQAPEAVRV